MTEKQFSMTSTQIAKVVGTVASPLIVVSELIKMQLMHQQKISIFPIIANITRLLLRTIIKAFHRRNRRIV